MGFQSWGIVFKGEVSFFFIVIKKRIIYPFFETSNVHAETQYRQIEETETAQHAAK